MFDLQAGVHFDEIEPIVLVEELQGADAAVAHVAHRRHRALADVGPRLGVEPGRRRLLQHLLMAPLERTIALAQMHHVAVAIGQDLDLDMARP